MEKITLHADGMTEGGMDIGQLFKALTKVLQEAPEAERKAFKDAWLRSVPEFNKRTEEIRFENWSRS